MDPPQPKSRERLQLKNRTFYLLDHHLLAQDEGVQGVRIWGPYISEFQVSPRGRPLLLDRKMSWAP